MRLTALIQPEVGEITSDQTEIGIWKAGDSEFRKIAMNVGKAQYPHVLKLWHVTNLQQARPV
jgi:hypothetical protein